jgi:RNA polymerase sigma-70 factor (ECF subfamily)
VIVLAFYGQLSHTEIAAQLGLPTGTVKGRMRLGLQKLRADIGLVGATPSPSNQRARFGF